MNLALSARAASAAALGRLPERRELESWLLAAFLSLAPATWLPGIPTGVFRWIAVALFLAAVGFVLGGAAASRSLRLPGGFLLGPWGFAALAALSIPGLVQTTSTFLIVDYLGDILRGALLLWCFFHLARRGDGQLQAVFRRTFLIVGALAAVAFLRLVLELPDLASPCRDLWRIGSTSGFNHETTGWGIGLAHLVPCAIFLALAWGRGGADRKTLLWFAATLLILASLLFSYSRTAMFMAVIAAAGFFVVPSSRRLASFLLVFVIGAGALATLNKECAYHFRLNWLQYFLTDSILPVAQAADAEAADARAADPQAGDARRRTPPRRSGQGRAKYPIPILESSGSAAWDELFNYRLTGFIKGFGYLRERPLRGYGLRGVLLNAPRVGKRAEVHNLWLKWALYTGVLAPAWFLVMAAAVVWMTWRVVRDRDGGGGGGGADAGKDRGAAVALALMVAIGLVATMSEPNALMGNFHRSASWWAAAGVIAGLYQARFRAAARSAAPAPAAEDEGTRRT